MIRYISAVLMLLEMRCERTGAMRIAGRDPTSGVLHEDAFQ